jgi:hypothetical protein
LSGDFSPSAFSALAFQLQAQQQALQLATAANSAVPAASANVHPAAAPLASNSFHIQEVLVRFPAANGQGTTSTLQLTLVDRSGNALIALSPALPNASNAPPAAIQNTPQAKSATA